MSKNNRTYTLEHKNRKAVVATGSLPIIKNYQVVGYTQPCTTVLIYCQKTGNLLDSYELPDYKEFSHYLSLVRYCNSVRHANKEQFFDKRLVPLSEHSYECSGASPIAPMSYTSTGSDTPILCPGQRGFSTEQFLSFILFLSFLFVLPVLGLYICYAVFFLGGVSDFFSAFYLFLTCFTAGIFGFLSFSKGG